MQAKIKSVAYSQSKVIKEIEALPDTRSLSWTKQEDDLIRKYYSKKGSRIADIMGRPRHQIWRRANQLGVPFKE